MSVHFVDGTIFVVGDCQVEDAETLLGELGQNPSAVIDIKDCGRLHMAVMQVMLVAARPIEGIPANAFVREWLLPQLLSAAD